MSTATDGTSRKASGFTIELDREAKVVRVAWLGQVTLELLRAGFSQTRQFARGLQLRGAISDFSSTDSFELSSDDVYILSREAPVFETQIPRVTVSGKEHIFGMARMFELLSDGRSAGIHVVHTMEEAYALLRLDKPEFTLIQVA
ncbi:MAG TPA: hypothetical protein VF786_00200 [Terriglobales bacterium]